MKRDTQLDIYRALSIMYVICVTHVLFWLNIGSEPMLSLVLIEMPLIFFISGAALSLKESPYGIFTMFWNRFKRVVMPFYIYAVVMIVIMAILTIFFIIFHCQLEAFYGLRFSNNVLNLFEYNWVDLLAILSCTDIPQAPFALHLWFILPYFIISCTFSLQIKLIKKINRWIYVSLTIVLFLTIQSVVRNIWCDFIFFYNIFMIIGYLFYKKIHSWQVLMIGLFSLAILVSYIIYGGWVIPMQCHKFPPDYIYLMYNLFVLCFICFVFKRISFSNNKILQIWNTRGYTIYLYQNIVFFLGYPIYWLLIRKISNQIVQWGLCAVIVFTLSTFLSYYTYTFERYVMRKLYE